MESGMGPTVQGDRRGFLKGFGVLLLIAGCVFVAYVLARGDAANMTAAFIRRVRAMGNPE
jgi:hypothetical protein